MPVKTTPVLLYEYKPANQKPKTLFEFAVRKCLEKSLMGNEYTHLQWANLLFSYDKSSTSRINLMSLIKQSFSIYFTNTNKYAFDAEKIKEHFPYLFGIQKEESDEYTIDELFDDIQIALTHELDEQRDPNNMQTFRMINLRLMQIVDGVFLYRTVLQIEEGADPNFSEGQPFFVKLGINKSACEAIDFEYDSNTLFFTAKRQLAWRGTGNVIVDSTFILNGLKDCLKRIAEKDLDDFLPIMKFIYDETEDVKKISHEPIPSGAGNKLDDSQKKAFQAAIDNDLTYIWGPPGTGKSYTLASIIYALYKMGEDRTAVCCLSNVAVDQLLNKVLDVLKDEKVRVGNFYRAGRTLDDRILATDYLFPNDPYTDDLRSKIKSNLDRLRVLKSEKKTHSDESLQLRVKNKELRTELKDYTEQLISNSKVVFSTISNFILSSSLNESQFDNLIVDEASMLALPSLIALSSNVKKRIILVGDFMQLSPIALTTDELLVENVFDMSGINIEDDHHKAMFPLLNQRRSQEKIVDLINSTFYKNKLVAHNKEIDTIAKVPPFQKSVIAMKDVKDGSLRFTKGGTRQNMKNATVVMDILDKYYQLSGNEDFSIGIITPYRGQVSLLYKLLSERLYPDEFMGRIKIGTIHTFQGSECDVIIYDVVDCRLQEDGKKSRIGKIYAGKEGEHLLNVAISRAKHKLIIVGEADFIRNVPGNVITPRTQKIFSRLCDFSRVRE